MESNIQWLRLSDLSGTLYTQTADHVSLYNFILNFGLALDPQKTSSSEEPFGRGQYRSCSDRILAVKISTKEQVLIASQLEAMVRVASRQGEQCLTVYGCPQKYRQWAYCGTHERLSTIHWKSVLWWDLASCGASDSIPFVHHDGWVY